MSFQELELSRPLADAISDLGYTEASDIQQKAIPILRTYEGDFVGQAQTGTGKTAAFVIPLLEKIDCSSSSVQALILTPTRELANQVYEEVNKLGKYLPVKATTVYGGVSYTQQINALKYDRPQIVVGTPGRIIDLIEKRILKLEDCRYLILDETDEMLNMGFVDEVQTIIDSLNAEKRMWMFSATMPAQITRLIRTKFSNPKVVKIETQTLSNASITQYYSVVRRRYFAEALLRILETTTDCYGMIFCETRQETKDLSELLIGKGISAVALHGELNQGQRDLAMKKFKERRVDLLICTDVGARGIDVTNMTHVFNMGLPRQNEAYVHRIGRTGRAGAEGTSITVVTPDDVRKIKRIEMLTHQKIELLTLPGPKELKKIKVLKEVDKFDSLKLAILEKDEEFKIDQTFELFENYFEEMNKDQILKLLFSYRFNKEIRQIDDLPHLDTAERSRSQSSSSRGRGNSFRGGNRSRSGSGGGGNSRFSNRSPQSGGRSRRSSSSREWSSSS